MLKAARLLELTAKIFKCYAKDKISGGLHSAVYIKKRDAHENGFIEDKHSHWPVLRSEHNYLLRFVLKISTTIKWTFYLQQCIDIRVVDVYNCQLKLSLFMTCRFINSFQNRTLVKDKAKHELYCHKPV